MGEVVEVSVDVANLVERFRLVKDKHDAIAVATGERFNVFEVLGVEWVEMKHSAMLAELLDPRGSHAQGAVFLRLFVEMIRVKFLQKQCLKLFDGETDGFIDDWEVFTEFFVSETARIDIFMKNDKINTCVVIENKICADDQEEQLGRYHEAVTEKFRGYDVVMIYLTLYEKKPGIGTLGEKLTEEDVLCVFHGKHIVEWLERCIEKMARVARVREIMLQYRSTLKKLTNQSMSRRCIMDTNKFFSKPENCKLIPNLEKAMSDFNVYWKDKFWEEVCGKLKLLLQPCSKYWLYANLNTGINKKIYFWVSMTGVSGKVGYGFQPQDEKGEEIYEDCDDEKYKKYRDALLDKSKLGKGDKKCLSTGDIYNGVQFGKPDEQLRQRLMCDDDRKIMTKQLVDEVKDILKRAREALGSVQ